MHLSLSSNNVAERVGLPCTNSLLLVMKFYQKLKTGVNQLLVKMLDSPARFFPFPCLWTVNMQL